MRRTVCCLFLLSPLFLLLPVGSYAGEQGLAVGYGFADFNDHVAGGEVEGGKKYEQ